MVLSSFPCLIACSPLSESEKTATLCLSLSLAQQRLWKMANSSADSTELVFDRDTDRVVLSCSTNSARPHPLSDLEDSYGQVDAKTLTKRETAHSRVANTSERNADGSMSPSDYQAPLITVSR